MTSVYVIIGIIVLCIGIGIQRLIVFLYNKQTKDIKKLYGQYFDFDISSAEHSVASFVEHLYPAFDMSDKMFYGRCQMTITLVSLYMIRHKCLYVMLS